MRWVQGRYKGYEMGMKQVKGVRDRYEVGERGIRWVQGR